MKLPLISVIMSVYNGEAYLREAIDSILGQTFVDFEFIVINDGSTDTTLGIIKSYTDSRIRIFNQSNIGLTKSLNYGIGIASGKYIARQDADDISELDRFEKQIKVFQSDESTALVSGNVRYFSEAWDSTTNSNRDIEPLLINWLLLFYNHIGGHSQVMFRRDFVTKIGGYNESLKYGQDYDLWLRISNNWKIIILPDVLVNFRHHDNRVSITDSSAQDLISVQTSIQYIQQYSNVIIGPDSLDLLRRFWIIYGIPLTTKELTTASHIFYRILTGLVANDRIDATDEIKISKLVLIFLGLNFKNKSSFTDRFKFSFEFIKWHFRTNFKAFNTSSYVHEKIR